MVDYTFDEDGNPIRRICESYNDQFEEEEDVMNIFDIKGDGFDVTLSLANGMIGWSTVNPAKAGKKFKKAKPYGTGTHHAGKFELPLTDIMGVRIKRQRSKGQQEGEGLCRGFTILTYEKFGPNCLKERVIDFEHPSESLCTQYSKSIKRYISGLQERPKSVKIFLQPFAGSHDGRNIYKNKVLPILQDAELNVDCTEILHNEHIKQEMIHINLDDYDCIIAMGGDGTATKTASGLLTASQTRKDVEIKNGFTPAKAPVPLGIIPTGTTNHIARSAMGISDPVTATIHIVLGHKQPVDVCSIFHDDHPVQWGFISEYGFHGNTLRYSTSYRSKAVPKFIEAAVVKALKPARLRAYDCDIEYIPAEKQDSKYKCLPCRTGCEVCWNEAVDDDEDDKVEECEVQPFNPLSVSNNSDTFVDLAQEENSNPWKKVKGRYMNVAVFAIPGFCEAAPEGLSKFSHLNDGCMELVLIREVMRKDFIRFLKRHGNAKNQFGFDFVEVIRAKQVKFRPRLPTGWNFKDHNFSEVEYQMNKLSMRKSKSETVIDMEKDLEQPGTQSMMSLDDLSDDEDLSDMEDSASGSTNPRSGSGNSIQKTKNQYKNNNNVIVNTAPQDVQLVGPRYRMTYADEDRMKRKKKEIKKEERKKAKEEKRIKSTWNIDNDICLYGELDFKVHHGILSFCGQGMAVETVVTDSHQMYLNLLR